MGAMPRPSRQARTAERDGRATILTKHNLNRKDRILKLDNLSWRARRKLEMYAGKMSKRAFDSDDVELFLVYAREAFKGEKGSVIRGFGDTMAHSIRDQGQLRDISKRLSELPTKELRTHPRRPLGNDAHVDEGRLREEVDGLLGEFGLAEIDQAAFDELKACLCVISNQTVFKKKEGDDKPIGEARTILLDGVVSLDVVSYDKRMQIITLQAPVQGYEGRLVDVGKHYAFAKREGPGQPLEVVCEGADIDCPSEPKPLESPTPEQVEYARKLWEEIAEAIERMRKESEAE